MVEKKSVDKLIRLNMAAFENERLCEELRAVVYASLDGKFLEGDSIVFALHQAAKLVLVSQNATARKPWISKRTLGLIDKRNEMRISGQHDAEIRIQKDIRISARHDRRNYLEELAGGGTQSQLKILRNGVLRMKGCLRTSEGVVDENIKQAETLADYFEKTQQRVKPFSNVGVKSYSESLCG